MQSFNVKLQPYIEKALIRYLHNIRLIQKSTYVLTIIHKRDVNFFYIFSEHALQDFYSNVIVVWIARFTLKNVKKSSNDTKPHSSWLSVGCVMNEKG